MNGWLSWHPDVALMCGGLFIFLQAVPWLLPYGLPDTEAGDVQPGTRDLRLLRQWLHRQDRISGNTGGNVIQLRLPADLWWSHWCSLSDSLCHWSGKDTRCNVRCCLTFEDYVKHVAKACNFHIWCQHQIRHSTSRDVVNTMAACIVGTHLDKCATPCYMLPLRSRSTSCS